MLASSVKSNTDKANYSAKAFEKQSMGTKGLNHFLPASLQISRFSISASYACLLPRDSAFQQSCKYCFGCRSPNNNTHAKQTNDISLSTEGAVVLMGNVVFGDNDEILTAAADWRVERGEREREREKGDREGGYWRTGAKLTAGSKELKMRGIFGVPTPFSSLLYFTSYSKKSSSA